MRAHDMKQKTEQSHPRGHKIGMCYAPASRLDLASQKWLYSMGRKGAYVHSKDEVRLSEKLKAIPVF